MSAIEAEASRATVEQRPTSAGPKPGSLLNGYKNKMPLYHSYEIVEEFSIIWDVQRTFKAI